MKKLMIALGSIGVLLTVGVVLVPGLIPASAYKRQLLDWVSAATGRTAQVNGKFGFTILPALGFFADNVSLANVPGATPADMITIDKLSLRVALMPLLSGRVVVRSLVLDKPAINLSVDKSGRGNWHFARRSEAPITAAATRGDGGPVGILKQLISGGVRIVDGKAAYIDARSGARHAANEINFKLLSAPSETAMTANGSLVWRNQKIALVLHLANPAALLRNQPTAANADLTARLLKLSFKGRLKPGWPIAANGTLAVEVASLRRFAAWNGSQLPASGSTFGPLALHGEATLMGPSVTLSHAVFSLDAIKADGDLRLDYAGTRPFVAAKLTLGDVDLNPYLDSPGPAAAASSLPSPDPDPPGWSTAPIEFSPLTRIDGRFDLTLAGFVVHKLAIGPSRASASLKNGRLLADFDRMAIYGGTGRARLSVDAAGTPRFGLSCNLSAVQLKPLLAATVGTQRLEGIADLDLQVTGHGRSQLAIVSSLSGSGRIAVRNGAILGVNLLKIVNSPAEVLNKLAAAHLPTVAGPSDKTVFSQLRGSSTIRNGVLFNNDLSLQSWFFRAGGRGSANLVRRTLNYRVEARLSIPSRIRIGGVTVSELTVPIIVTGSWDNPSYRADLNAVLREIAQEKLMQQLQDKIPGGAAGKALGGFFQSLPGGNAAPNPGDVLHRLFGY